MSAGAPWPGPELQRKLDSLWVDWYTGRVVQRMRERGVESLLLKGPAIARWLYADDPGARRYIDADLLVAPNALGAAERALAELGFAVEELPWLDAEQPHAKSWRRPDGAVVDLHRVPLGFEHLDPAAVWALWRAGAQTLEVGEVRVLAPSAPARLLALVLAVRPELDERAHELMDLDRALGVVGLDTWREAATLARALGLECDAGYALSRRPGGAELADRLELCKMPPLRVLLATDPLLRAVGHLLRIRGPRAKLRYLRRRLLPPASYLREHHPRAARSVGGIAAAYIVWALSGLLGVPRALVTWWRATREWSAARGGAARGSEGQAAEERPEEPTATTS